MFVFEVSVAVVFVAAKVVLPFVETFKSNLFLLKKLSGKKGVNDSLTLD